MTQLKAKSRITPACAGNREIKGTYESLEADHPRVCGEQFPYEALFPWEEGSPPRVRGTAEGS